MPYGWASEKIEASAKAFDGEVLVSVPELFVICQYRGNERIQREVSARTLSESWFATKTFAWDPGTQPAGQ